MLEQLITLTHEVGKPPNRKPASPSHKLQQTHPLLIVHFFYKLKTEKRRTETTESFLSSSELTSQSALSVTVNKKPD